MIMIHRVSKYENHVVYALEKKQEFFFGFRKFLEALGFGDENSDPGIYGFGRSLDNDGEPITSKEDDIDKYVDKHYSFRDDKYIIDVIFSAKKVYMIISTKKDRQDEISKQINDFCSFES